MKQIPAPTQISPIGRHRIWLPAGNLIVDGNGQEHGVKTYESQKYRRGECQPPRRAPRSVQNKSHCEGKQKCKRIPERHRRAENLRQGLGGLDMHRVFKAADARVKEHRHGKFATGHRPRDHNSGDLKSMNDVGIHRFASSITATARTRKSPNEIKIGHAAEGEAGCTWRVELQTSS